MALFFFISCLFSLILYMEGTGIRELRSLIESNFWRYWDWPSNDKQLYYEWKKGVCSLNDVNTWPVDGTKIFDDGRHVLILGSIKSACEIEAVNRRIGVPIDVVVTMNADDTPRDGEPANYAAYYRSLGVKNLRYGGIDSTALTGAEYQTKKREYIIRWQAMCDDIDDVTPVTGKVTILFHCFGGVNRSGSALCAFLIMRKHHSAEEAVTTLVNARPGQLYWSKRDYFIEALIEVAIRARNEKQA